MLQSTNTDLFNLRIGPQSLQYWVLNYTIFFEN